ncbi:hypothetical protein VB264_02085 [Arcicella aquatica]|uniref:Uncharacterized protein n=1 Tax=Arcicella aquatica TaxID=217141 RepID=A0ABU5QHM9_9BACT|nr:hypothetical protein [Arcicella aquatica]MEA5256553.1 hypothetical protein [Arcicella aquatica]
MKKNIFLFAVVLTFSLSKVYAVVEEEGGGTTTICPGKGALCKKSNGWITINDEKDKAGPAIVITF